MMLRIVSLTLALALAVAFAPIARAESPQPLAVLSLCSQQSSVGPVQQLTTLAEAPDLPVWMASILKVYSQGRYAAGLDGSRPWGIVLQGQDCLQGYGFLPITSAEALAGELRPYIAQTNQIESDLYELVGTQSNQKVYVRLSGDWIFASDSRAILAKLPSDPTKLLGGLEKQYDVALRVNASAIPYMQRQNLNAQLGGQLRVLVSQLGSSRTANALEGTIEQLDSLTLGWGAHAK